MPMTLTNLIQPLYSALDVVSRELTGMIPAVTLDARASQAAIGQNVFSFAAPASVAADIVAASEVPDAGDQVIGSPSLAITKSRSVQLRWTGEEELSVSQSFGAGTIQAAQLQQGFRTLVNEMEIDLAMLYTKASRQQGVGTTVPFATAGDYTDASLARKILVDNGAPTGDMQLVVNTGAGANLRGKQGGKANEAGTDLILRQGVLLDVHGFSIRESAGIRTHIKGTGASYTSNTAGYAVGATVITLITGTGTVLAGDTVTFAGDANKYVVAVGVAAPGAITLAAPGLLVALAASAVAMTIDATGPRSMAFARSAIVLAARLPALPAAGDKAVDRTIIQDPRTGLAFELALYPGFRRMNWMLGIAWGVGMMKTEHTALLAG